MFKLVRPWIVCPPKMHWRLCTVVIRPRDTWSKVALGNFRSSYCSRELKWSHSAFTSNLCEQRWSHIVSVCNQKPLNERCMWANVVSCCHQKPLVWAQKYFLLCTEQHFHHEMTSVACWVVFGHTWKQLLWAEVVSGEQKLLLCETKNHLCETTSAHAKTPKFAKATFDHVSQWSFYLCVGFYSL